MKDPTMHRRGERVCSQPCALYFIQQKGVTALVSEQAVCGLAVNFKAGVGQGGHGWAGPTNLWNNENLVRYKQTQNQGLR